MVKAQKHDLMELEILKHVDETPLLNNRKAANKLGCSVKLAHQLLGNMVSRGLLHVKKHHSRRWDYFLTPKGIAEKARLTYEFLDFSMQFYKEARKTSSQVCKDIAASGKKTVAFLGAGDLAEIVYLGVKEWGLELTEVFAENHKKFLDISTKPLSSLDESEADVIIVCLYDKSQPMSKRYLPSNIKPCENICWVF